MRPRKRLTGQANLRFNEASKAKASRLCHSERLRGGLAASYVAASLIWLIVIWYGQDLTV